MIHIQGYWLLNGHKTDFVSTKGLYMSRGEIEDYRAALKSQHKLEPMFKYREIPDEIEKLIQQDYMRNQPALKTLAAKYGVSQTKVGQILTNLLTND